MKKEQLISEMLEIQYLKKRLEAQERLRKDTIAGMERNIFTKKYAGCMEEFIYDLKSLLTHAEETVKKRDGTGFYQWGVGDDEDCG